jgi:hypothetical protein
MTTPTPKPEKPRRCKYCHTPVGTAPYVYDIRGYVCDADDCNANADEETRERDEEAAEDARWGGGWPR